MICAESISTILMDFLYSVMSFTDALSESFAAGSRVIKPFSSRMRSALYSFVPSLGIATTASAGISSVDEYLSEYAVMGSMWIPPALASLYPLA